MSNLNRFFKENKTQKENTTYAATKSLTDDDGKPLCWTIRPISTKENNRLQAECMYEVPIKGKPNMFREKLNATKYQEKLLCASVVEPNLNDKELQDSYGVMTPEELILEMIDDPGEYADFQMFVTQLNGFTDINDDIQEAKN